MIEINNKQLIKKSYSKLVISGNVLERYQYEKPYFYNFAPRKKRLTGDTSLVSSMGGRRRDNTYRSAQKIKRIVFANDNLWNCKSLFLTFTFAENVTSVKGANVLWSQYVRKFNNFLRKRGYEKAKFLTVVEFQKRGAVHYHTIYFNIPFIKGLKEHIEDMWEHGFIKVISLEKIKYIGNYVSKYLQKGITDDRLKREKAFFTSRGLHRPIEIRNEENVLAILDNSDTISLSDTTHVTSAKYGKIDYYRYIHKI